MLAEVTGVVTQSCCCVVGLNVKGAAAASLGEFPLKVINAHLGKSG
jgi:hypothetical protein